MTITLVFVSLVQRFNNRHSQVGLVQFALSKEVQEIGNYFMKNQVSDHDFKKFLIKIKASQKVMNKYL